jgi:predicted secreted protein
MTSEGPAVELWADETGLLDVQLAESPSTGYRWELEGPPDQVEVVSSRFDSGEAGTQAGSGGVRTFAIRLLADTDVDLVFGLSRVWESEPMERRVVTVHVPPAGPDPLA